MNRFSTFSGPRKPLNKVSAKRANEDVHRWAIRTTVLERDRHRCLAIGLIPGHACYGPLEVHEIDKRSRKPGCHLSDNLDDYLTLCSAANQWVEDNPQEAHDLGLARWSWESAPTPIAPEPPSDPTPDSSQRSMPGSPSSRPVEPVRERTLKLFDAEADKAARIAVVTAYIEGCDTVTTDQALRALGFEVREVVGS